MHRGDTPFVSDSSVVENSELGSWVSIGPHCSIVESRLGDYTYTAGDAQIIYSTVGKFCSIASHVRVNPGNHPMWRVSQHHMTYRRKDYGFGDTDDEGFFAWRKDHEVVIGHDVWLGHASVVMPGVNIGTGAVVGAGAVVTKLVEPYMVVAGVPAKIIKPRFPRDVVNALLEIAWWDWSRGELEERMNDFADMNGFLAKYESLRRRR